MVNFNFSFNPGTSLQQMIGFEMAGRVWSSYLTDNTTVNIQVGVSNQLPGNVIGGALPGMKASASYSSFLSQLQADATSLDDQTAIANIPDTKKSVKSWFCTWSMDYSQPGYGFSFNTSKLNLTRANAKALGINVTCNADALDGYILFSDLSQAKNAAGQSITWNYDYTRQNIPASNSLDFLTTAIHEIGHILGFTSSVDAPGWLNVSTLFTNQNAYYNNLAARAQNINPLDLFRYSQETASYGAIDLAIGGTGANFLNKYFSIDGGWTQLANFAAGVDTTLDGDGAQASHWQAGTNAIMAPTLQTGTYSSITSLDLKTFDVIGWDIVGTGINTPIDLSRLLNQCKQSLADRLGQIVSWLDANATTAANSLAQNRDQDIYTMLVQSKIYDLGRITPPGSGGGGSLTFTQLFEERGLFDTIDELQVITASNQPSLEALTSMEALPSEFFAGGQSLSLTVQFQVTKFPNPSQLNRNRITPPGSGDGPSSIWPGYSFNLSIELQVGSSNASAESSDSSATVSTYYWSTSDLTIGDQNDSATASQTDSALSDILEITALV